jgi:hypothetical protein
MFHDVSNAQIGNVSQLLIKSPGQQFNLFKTIDRGDAT